MTPEPHHSALYRWAYVISLLLGGTFSAIAGRYLTKPPTVVPIVIPVPQPGPSPQPQPGPAPKPRPDWPELKPWWWPEWR